MYKQLFACFLVLFSFGISSFSCNAQSNFRGYVLNEQNLAVPYANIFVKETMQGTTTNPEGQYSIMLIPGEYTVVFSCIGYESIEVTIKVKDQEIIKNVWLKTSLNELNEIVVKSKRKDPAYEIIQKVIAHKEQHLSNLQSKKSKVYLKATEYKETKNKPVEVQADNEDLLSREVEPKDFDDVLADTTSEKKASKYINMVEIEMWLHFAFPKYFKEEKTAVRYNGQISGLFVPKFSQIDFNFYHNLLYLKGIAEQPIISPLSTTAILTYKYKLEEQLVENNQLIYKIKAWPRKTGNSSLEGYIYVNASDWSVRSFEFELYKGSLKLFDEFKLKIDYQLYNDSIWVVSEQRFTYLSKNGKKTTNYGETLIKHDSIEINPIYPRKFFSTEVSVTAKDAYEKDSTYWGAIRPVPLTIEEQETVRKADSIKAVHSSKAYKDSLDALFNKVTLAELLYDGVGFRKTDNYLIGLPSLLSMFNFEVVGGFRIGSYENAYKRFKSGKTLYMGSYQSIGFKNADFQGNYGIRYRYNPFKFSDVWLNIGKYYTSINWFDAYLNQLRVSNYILEEQVSLGHSFELLNGLFLHTTLSHVNRKPLDGIDTRTFLNDLLGEPEPLDFQGYKSLVSDIRISFTPFQQYATEPTRKLILGSRWPRFSLRHEKGWNNLFGSEIDYDFLEFDIFHRFNVHVLGKSLYTFSLGSFINKKDLRFIDYKRFRQSDPYLYSNPLYSFQVLDTSLAISGTFAEFHYIHHFNGAIINNIPLLKKTRIMTLAGAGALWVPEANYRYAEVYAGVERLFKLGDRRRLKIGLFAVVGQSNQIRTTPAFKISFDVIDTWKREWSY